MTMANQSNQNVTAQAPLGQLLVRRGALNEEQLEQALEFQKTSEERKLIGEVLVHLGFVNQQMVLETLAEAYGIPFASDTARLADPKVVVDHSPTPSTVSIAASSNGDVKYACAA